MVDTPRGVQNPGDIAQEIQVQLIRRKLTEQWLADELGISRGTLRRRMKDGGWRRAELALLTAIWGVDFRQNHTHSNNGT